MPLSHKGTKSYALCLCDFVAISFIIVLYKLKLRLMMLEKRGHAPHKNRDKYRFPLTLIYDKLEFEYMKIVDYIWSKKGLCMKMSESVKSISYLKANAADMIDEINKDQKTYIITQNGEAKVIVQDIKVYEKTQETMAMLKLMAMTRNKSREAKGIRETFSDLRNELKSNK